MDDSGAGRFVDKNKAREKRGGLGRPFNPYAQETDEMKAHATEMCRPAIVRYVNCTKDKTFSGIWMCRDHLKEMEACLAKYENKYELALRVRAKKDAEAKAASN
eukprot:TRINITY_DN23845_c0_g1_i2.p1 TRINITY_DN23845_c0_g1~~TRINITY_DN23845_c0_g1_i2.p1  ORF type:complete len:104 (-),score=25.26 TRINITY_DN23845_c0_g1_i2:280-591(-)